jgi:xanthine dehydrogenase YagT iron-sulfur-binding subunit
VKLRINGVVHDFEVPASEILVDSLRDRLGLTGAKQACSMGNCGACTVRLDGVTVYSCLVLAVECDAGTVDTIEGLADRDRLDVVQSAFLDADAFQCGFCTPGQILSVRAVLDAIDRPSDADLVHGLAGNLCRCGAYEHILNAARLAAAREAASDE